jgi:hypothetical protein
MSEPLSSFFRYVRRPLLLGLILSFLLVACTPPVSPTPTDAVTEEGQESSQPGGEDHTVYLPLSQSNENGGLTLPSESPVAEWNTAGGIVPIMPGATAGQAMNGGYAFTTSASIADLVTFYQQEMSARGWQVLSLGESMEVKDLLFQIGEMRLKIHIEFLSAQNLSYVFIEG